MSLRSVYDSETLMILGKPPRTHFDEILEGIAVEGGSESWEAVHRLDYETSGLICFAKKKHVEQYRTLFKTVGAISKQYLAFSANSLEGLSCGQLRECRGYIASRYRASKKTRYLDDDSTAKKFHSFRPAWHQVQALGALSIQPDWQCELKQIFAYRVFLETGARHQIRSYFSAQNAALLGDSLYGGVAAPRLGLHAERLVFNCPLSQEPIDVKLGWPEPNAFIESAEFPDIDRG